MEEITEKLKDHYRKKFLEFGPTSKGVDWGREEDVLLRHKLMYDLIENDYCNEQITAGVSLLDVGCGYGAFYDNLETRSIDVSYTGIDPVEEMINYGKRNHLEGNFILGDFMELDALRFDYVICNGILTQKLTSTILDMDRFANRLIKKMFASANKGIAFNIMSSKVNFMVENLYYRHPADTFAFCLTELSTKVRIEHAYPMYEYTVYVYRG